MDSVEQETIVGNVNLASNRDYNHVEIQEQIADFAIRAAVPLGH